MNISYNNYRALLCVLAMFLPLYMYSQERPEATIVNKPQTFVWLNTYGKIKLGDKWYWTAETHFRTQEYNNTDYVGRFAQWYNRHGAQYIFNPNFSATAGVVLRLNFTPEPGDDNFEKIVLEPRFWHEYMFSMPLFNFMAYHRLRFEHRFSRSNLKGSDYNYRNRYRYKFFLTIPLNNSELTTGTFYLQPDVEVILQSGNPVIDSPLDDLRLSPKIGYIASPRLKYSLSMMYTTGQTLDNGAIFDSRWILNFNVYFNLDFRPLEKRLPQSKIRD